MRKFLSLVLALVMVMSLTTLTAGAKEFTDADSINYDEAVDVISALGVVDGYAGGEFGPSGILTRQAAAKIICNLVLGPTTARALVADAAPFPDVPTSSEFAGYIAYCAQKGIIGGYPDGSFRPGGSLTGYAFMKMLLGALGYDASIEKFGGPNWSINVGKLALGIGLDKGLLDAFDGTKAVTREEAALYALNTLKGTMVEYGQKINVTSENGSTVSIANNEAKAVDQGVYKDNLNDSGLQFAERYFDDLKLNNADEDDFGRPSNTWTLKSTKIGTYARSADLVASYNGKVSKGDMYEILSSSVRKDVNNTPAYMHIWVNGEENPVTNAKIGLHFNGSGLYERNNSSAIYTAVDGSSRKGTLTEVYVRTEDTTDGKGNVTGTHNEVDVIIIDTFVYQATSDYSESRDDVKMTAVGDTKLSLKNGELTLSGEDFLISDIKADDYLLVTAAYTSSGYEVKTVAVAEKVEGEVSAYSDNDSVTIDGTKYSYSATTLKDTGVRGTTYTVGQPAIVVLDAYGNVIVVDEAVASSNFVFVKQFGGTSGLNKKAVADAYFTDGTNEEISIDRVGDTKSATTITAMGKVNRWYTYSTTGDGKYVLYDVPTRYKQYDETASAKQLIHNGKVDFLQSVNTKRLANDKTILVMVDKDGDVMTYTGTANIPDVTLKTGSATVYCLEDRDGYTDYAFVDLENKNVSVVDGGEDASFVYVLKFDKTMRGSNATTYYTYKTINDETGDEEIRNFDLKLFSSNDVYGLYYKPRTNADQEISNLTKVPASDGKYYNVDFNKSANARVTYKDGSLSVGSKSWIFNSSSKLIVIARKDCGIMKDESADYEIRSMDPRTLESQLDHRTFEGNVAGCTVSASSNVVDTMYVTVGNTTEFTFSGVSVDKTSVTLDEANKAKTAEVKVTLPASGYTIERVASRDTNIATVVDASGTLTITAASAGDTAIDIQVKQTATGVVETYVVNVHVTPDSTLTGDREKLDKMEELLNTLANTELAGASTPEESADILSKIRTEFAKMNGYDVNLLANKNAATDIDLKAGDGNFVKAINGASKTDDNPQDGKIVVTMALKSGTVTKTAEVTFVIKGLAWAETDAGKAEAADKEIKEEQDKKLEEQKVDLPKKLAAKTDVEMTAVDSSNPTQKEMKDAVEAAAASIPGVQSRAVTTTVTVTAKEDTLNWAAAKEGDTTKAGTITGQVTITVTGAAAPKSVSASTADVDVTVNVKKIVAPCEHSLTKTEAKAATCKDEGNNAYWTCSKCDKVFADEDATEETTVKAQTLAKLTTHTLSATAAKEATCTAAGNNAYWTCSVCGKVFSDEGGKTETTVEDQTLNALGHDFQLDSANNKHVCSRAVTCKDAGHTVPTAAANKVKGCAECDKLTGLT